MRLVSLQVAVLKARLTEIQALSSHATYEAIYAAGENMSQK